MSHSDIRLAVIAALILFSLVMLAKSKGVVATASRYFFASLLSEDDGNKVPDQVRILWFGAALLFLGAIILFLYMSYHWAFDRPPCLPTPGLACPEHHIDLMGFAAASAAMFGGFATFMVGCAGALALKTKSGA